MFLRRRRAVKLLSSERELKFAGYSDGSLDRASAYVAVIVTSIEGIVAVVVSADGFARIWVSPLQPANFFPGSGGSAVTVTVAPVSYPLLPLPSFTVRVGDPAAVACVPGSGSSAHQLCTRLPDQF